MYYHCNTASNTISCPKPLSTLTNSYLPLNICKYVSEKIPAITLVKSVQDTDTLVFEEP